MTSFLPPGRTLSYSAQRVSSEGQCMLAEMLTHTGRADSLQSSKIETHPLLILALDSCRIFCITPEKGRKLPLGQRQKILVESFWWRSLRQRQVS